MLFAMTGEQIELRVTLKYLAIFDFIFIYYYIPKFVKSCKRTNCFD